MRFRPGLLLFQLLSTILLLPIPRTSEAQQTARVAFLCAEICSTLPNAVYARDQAFLRGLEQAGYVVGRNVFLDLVGIGVGYDRLREVAQRLVHRRADIIVAFGNAAAVAASRATKTTPIVMVGVADPMDEGLVASLGRPGGNVTGLTVPFEQLAAKHVELLKAIQPRLVRVATFWNPTIELHKQRVTRLEAAARRVGVQLYSVEAATFRDLEMAFASVARVRADGLMLLEHLNTVVARGEIATFALQHRLPTVASDGVFVEAGGLMAYGPHLAHLYERAAIYVGKLLKGAKPSELPVEEPTRFELIISKTTARALGLTIPPSILLRADRVAE